MKIVLVGASGTIGKEVAKLLKARHTVIAVGKTQGDYTVDIRDENQITQMFEKIGSFDALVCTAGKVHFAPLGSMTSANYHIGLHDKLMGQVNLVLIGKKFMDPKGSFTLTSGILGHDPIISASSASMVNGAIESFVKAAAIELGQMRINAVSPTILTESVPFFGGLFAGFEPIPGARAALAYLKSVEGHQTGQVYRVT